MPELPEVETVRLGLINSVKGQSIKKAMFYCKKLRYPIDSKWKNKIIGKKINGLSRRGKYLIFHLKPHQRQEQHLGFEQGLIWHLGMSGSLRLVKQSYQLKKHDHIDIELSNGQRLIYNDPRRFGLLLFSDQPKQHRLLQHLGPEPLSKGFNTNYLMRALENKKTSIKQAIMDNNIIVGVGNIYASESLFRASISPQLVAYQLSDNQATQLVNAIKLTLEKAIAAGGSSLKDFINSDGNPGYFQQQLLVYDRAQQPCYWCDNPIIKTTLGGRSTFHCPICQANSQTR